MKSYSVLIIFSLILISCLRPRVKEDFYFYHHYYSNDKFLKHKLLNFNGVYVNEKTWTTKKFGSHTIDSSFVIKIYLRFFSTGLCYATVMYESLFDKYDNGQWSFFKIEGDTIYMERFTNYYHGYFVKRGVISKDRIDFIDRIQYNYPRRKNIKPDFYQDFSKNTRINLEDEPTKVFKFMKIKGIEDIILKNIDSLSFD